MNIKIQFEPFLSWLHLGLFWVYEKIWDMAGKPEVL